MDNCLNIIIVINLLFKKENNKGKMFERSWIMQKELNDLEVYIFQCDCFNSIKIILRFPDAIDRTTELSYLSPKSIIKRELPYTTFLLIIAK